MDERERRDAWFNWYFQRTNDGVIKPRSEGVRYECPCCGYPTLEERGSYDICEICGWEDDGQDDPYAEEIWGGPNYSYSLAEARENYRRYLTKYRPTDEEKFQRETAPQRLAEKQRLIAQYNSTKLCAR